MDISSMFMIIEDPRRDIGKKYSLESILFMATAAAIGGAETGTTLKTLSSVRSLSSARTALISTASPPMILSTASFPFFLPKAWRKPSACG